MAEISVTKSGSSGRVPAWQVQGTEPNPGAAHTGKVVM
jgi:hypothetical protein